MRSAFHSIQARSLVLCLLLLASFTRTASADDRKSVIVIGGGYAGVEAATRLAKDPGLRVVLLDKAPKHTEITRLHQMATAPKPIQHQLKSIAQNHGFEFRHAEVTGIALKAKTVQTRGGPIAYDAVIVAVGGATSWPNVPGLKTHGLGLRTPREAMVIRDNIHKNLSKAATTADPTKRKALARIVVAGAGLTGVEMAAEMAQAIPKLAKQHGLLPADISVHLVQRGPEILSKVSDFKPKDRTLVRQKLEAMGVVVHTSTQLKKLYKGHMLLATKGGTIKLAANTLIWAGGVKASPIVAKWGLPVGQQGRITVDAKMRVLGAPGVYAVGDSAAALNPKTKGFAAMTAQEAKIQAKVAAKNIGAARANLPLIDYRPKSAGTLVSLGSKDGVGRVFGIRVRGRLASFMKRGIEIRHKRALRLGTRSPKHGRKTRFGPRRAVRVRAKARAR